MAPIHPVPVRKHRAKKLSGLKPTFPGWRWMVSLSGLFLPGLSPNLEPRQFPGLTEELLPSPPQLPSPSPLPLSSLNFSIFCPLLFPPFSFPLPFPVLSFLLSSASPSFFSSPHPSHLSHALPFLIFLPTLEVVKFPLPAPALQGLEGKA